MRLKIVLILLVNTINFMRVTGANLPYPETPATAEIVPAMTADAPADKSKDDHLTAIPQKELDATHKHELDPKLVSPESEIPADAEDEELVERKKRWPYHNNNCYHRTCHWHDYGYWAHGHWHPNKRQFCEWVDHCHHHHH